MPIWKFLLIVPCTAALASNALAEQWQCKPTGFVATTVIATHDFRKQVGPLSISGIEFQAQTSMNGPIRRWEWDSVEAGQSANHALAIEPNGMGSFYRYNNKAWLKTSSSLLCQQSLPDLQAIKEKSKAIAEEFRRAAANR